MTDTKHSNGFAQISMEEYDRLRAAEKTLSELLNSDKCVEVACLYSYDRGRSLYIINPPPDFKELVKTLTEEQDKTREKYWKIRSFDKRITIFDIGKKISSFFK